MEFRILGRLEVVEGQRSLPLGGAKQRALLAVLLMDPNRVVSTERLIDALWGESAPDGALHTIQVYVSQLRKALRADEGRPPGDVLVTQGRGYLLRVEAGQIDLERFEETIERGRRSLSEGTNDRAAALFREALDLWRGPPLADLELEAYAEPYIARIEDLRQSAVEDRIEADLALGRHAELAGELQALVAEFPLRERLRGQLMLALYRSGRQAEALAAYRDAKEMLADELGIDPSPDLQRLEGAILRQDPELDLVPVPTGLEPTRPAGEPLHRRKRRGGSLLIGVAAALVAVVLIASVVILSTGEGGTAHPSAVGANNVGRIDAQTDELVAAIPTTGTVPTAVVWADGSLWVANTVSRTVARIDPETDRVVRTVSTGGAPTDLAAGDGRVWVLDGLDGSVLAIDPQSNEVTATIEVPVGSGGIAVGAGGVWVTNSLDATVTRISPQTQQVVGSIPVGVSGSASPEPIAAHGDSLWVGDGFNPLILQIDVGTGEVVASPGLRAVPTEIAIGAGGEVWVSSYDAGLVSVVDPDTLQVTTIPVGRGPTGIAVDAEWTWVADSTDGAVSRIDPRSERVVGTIRTGNVPEGVALGGGSVWVSVHV